MNLPPMHTPLKAGDQLTLIWNTFQTGEWYWNEMASRVEESFLPDSRLLLVYMLHDDTVYTVTFAVQILAAAGTISREYLTTESIRILIEDAVVGVYPATFRGRYEPAVQSSEPETTSESASASTSAMTYKGRKLIPLDENQALKPGDRILLRFGWIGGNYSRAAEWAIIESVLEKQPEFTVLSYINGDTTLDVELLIKKGEFEQFKDQPFNTEIYEGMPGMSTLGAIGTAAVKIVTWAAIASIVLYATEKAFKKAGYLIGEPIKETVEELNKTQGGQAALFGIGAFGVAILIVAGIVAAKSFGLIE